jgi:hypothetical protein
MEDDIDEFAVSPYYARNPKESSWEVLSRWWLGPPLVTVAVFLLCRGVAQTTLAVMSFSIFEKTMLYMIPLFMWMRWANRRETDYLLYCVHLVRNDISAVHMSNAETNNAIYQLGLHEGVDLLEATGHIL